MKEEMIRFWEETPCGTRDLLLQEGSREFFSQLEQERDRLEPFIAQYASFTAQRGRDVLEVGIGSGTDFIRFARAGARVSGVDITAHAVRLAQTRLLMENLSAQLIRADSECLPFENDSFDFVYSWGVIHHTQNTEVAAKEIVRVTRPGGRVCVMVYHRHSCVAAQCWVLYGLLKGKFRTSVSECIWNHIESVGTKAFTVQEATLMFSGLMNVVVKPVLTPYDGRISRSRFLPLAMRSIIPSRFGWFLVIRGQKPE